MEENPRFIRIARFYEKQENPPKQGRFIKPVIIIILKNLNITINNIAAKLRFASFEICCRRTAPPAALQRRKFPARHEPYGKTTAKLHIICSSVIIS